MRINTSLMRPTVNIADGVFQAAELAGKALEIGRRTDVSETARRTLPAREPSSTEETTAVYGFEPFPVRGGIITNELIDMLCDDDA
jgi:hypothetical protein